VGQVLQRTDDLDAAREPLELIVERSMPMPASR
jgi:hypothetical protein